MKRVKAKHIMKRGMALRASATWQDVILKVLSAGHGVAVVDERTEVVGVVTEFDMLRAIKEYPDLSGVTAAQLMSKPPKTADIETPADVIIDTMIENNLTVVPIVHNGRFVGVLSRHEILDAYVTPELERYFEE